MDDDYIPLPLSDEEQELATERRRKLRENAAPTKKRRITLVGLFISLVSLSIVVAFFYVFMMPNDVVERWPSATAFYDSLGMRLKQSENAPPNVEIKPYATKMVAVGDVYKLTVSGHIVNKGFGSVTIPAVVGTLLNAEGREIYTWMFCLPNRRLVAGQGIDYEYDIIAAPFDTSVAVIKIKWEKDADGNVIDICPPLS